MSKKISIHPQLHDIFGEQQTIIELLMIVFFGVTTPIILYIFHTEYFSDLPIWKMILAMIFITDIAAGCVANFTRSTNKFYATRTKHRWIFIAIHFHIIIVAYGLNADIYSAIYIWAYTMFAASTVNLLKSTQIQVVASGFLLAIGLSFGMLLPNIHPIMAILQSLYMLKVIYSFSVDHYPDIEAK